jgi:hypothetical protein
MLKPKEPVGTSQTEEDEKGNSFARHKEQKYSLEALGGRCSVTEHLPSMCKAHRKENNEIFSVLKLENVSSFRDTKIDSNRLKHRI